MIFYVYVYYVFNLFQPTLLTRSSLPPISSGTMPIIQSTPTKIKGERGSTLPKQISFHRHRSTMTMLKTEKHVAKREDTLDSLFEWAERTFCPAGMRNYKPEPKADTLDYVFEHVVRRVALFECNGNIKSVFLTSYETII